MVVIRAMKPSDVSEVILIGKAAHELAVSDVSFFWGESRLEPWVRAQTDIMLVATKDDKVVGALLTNCHLPSRVLYLSDLVVEPAMRGQGVGTSLLLEGIAQAKQRGLDYGYGLTQLENERIQKILAKHGFSRGETMVWFERKPL